MEEDGGEMTRIQVAAEAYRVTREAHIAARDELHAAIRAGLAAGLPIGQVATESGFDREHVRRIRDGKIGPRGAMNGAARSARITQTAV